MRQNKTNNLKFVGHLSISDLLRRLQIRVDLKMVFDISQEVRDRVLGQNLKYGTMSVENKEEFEYE